VTGPGVGGRHEQLASPVAGRGQRPEPAVRQSAQPARLRHFDDRHIAAERERGGDRFPGGPADLDVDAAVTRRQRRVHRAVPAVRDRDLFGHYAGDRRGQAPGQVRGHLLGGQ
jgi:hypothetical protein